MLKDSYKREDITPPLSREEGRSHNSGTGTDTNNTVKQTNTHKRRKKNREQASAKHGLGGGSGGPWSNCDRGHGGEHAHLPAWKRYAIMKRSKLAKSRPIRLVAGPMPPAVAP